MTHDPRRGIAEGGRTKERGWSINKKSALSLGSFVLSIAAGEAWFGSCVMKTWVLVSDSVAGTSGRFTQKRRPFALAGRSRETMLSYAHHSLRFKTSAATDRHTRKFHRIRSRGSTVLASGTSSQDEVRRLAEIEECVRQLNNGTAVNLNSPKQVAALLYHLGGDGDSQGTSRAVLQRLATSSSIPFQAQLAKLVLEHRDARRKGCPTTVAARFSTQTTSVCEDQHGAAAGESGSLQTPTDTIGLSAVNREAVQALSPYQVQLSSIFSDTANQIDVFWRDALERIQRPSARAIVKQLDGRQCPMGYDPLATPYATASVDGDGDGDGEVDEVEVETRKTATTAGKKGSLLAYVRDEKCKYSECVLLVRVGEFYEAFGIDAVLLVEHCGLNPMAGKARAGCPLKNIQATLDCLTNAGFSVAVYEEAIDTDASAGRPASGGSRSRLKNRMLAQIVSSASPTYLYDLVLGDNGGAGSTADCLSAPPARPYVGVVSTNAGYTLVEVSWEERTARVSERLTAEAVACRLAAYPPADPLFFVPLPGIWKDTVPTNLPFLPSRSDASSDGPGSHRRLKVIPSPLMEAPSPGSTDVERAGRCVVSSLLQTVDHQGEAQTNGETFPRPNRDDFVLISSSEDRGLAGGNLRTQPLYVETATQLGLMDDSAIPPLVHHLVPKSAPSATRRFLRRWLLTPPTPEAADAMATLVRALKEEGAPSLPQLAVPPVGKLLALTRAGQASAPVFREILSVLRSTASVLEEFSTPDDSKPSPHSRIVESLMGLLQFETGMAADPTNLRLRCIKTIEFINGVVSSGADVSRSVDPSSNFGDIIPPAFFERNEAVWRSCVKSDVVFEAYDGVTRAANKLAEAVATDFWGVETEAAATGQFRQRQEEKSPIVQDIFNNIIALKEAPSWAVDQAEYIHPRDRNGKILRNRFTTARVQSKLSDYVEACEHATRAVTAALTSLSQGLCNNGHLPSIVQASHSNLILSTAVHHAAQANYLGWDMADIVDSSADPNASPAGQFVDVWPYWMDRSEAVVNSFDLDGMILLTAPNMSGKSTLMRSTAAAALLTACGLCAPLSRGSTLRRFDSIFVRGASSDIPTEDKSAFGAEMGDVAALLRSCGDRSLVFVDELGRGTSPKDGTSLAAALVEDMAESGMSGIFATHLHGILDMPLNSDATARLRKKRMALQSNEKGDIEWTYKLEDGVCRDSLALVTAAKFGLPPRILQRAQHLASVYGEKDVAGSTTAMNANKDGRDPDQGINHYPEYATLEDAIKIAIDVAGESAGEVVHIPPQWTSPPSLEGQSCVYILHVGPNQYYVGETDALSQRLAAHRSKSGEDWSGLRAAAIAIRKGGKTNARHVESLVLRRMARAGFDLISFSDGQVVRSLGRR